MGMLQAELDSALSRLPWTILTQRIAEQMQAQGITLSHTDRRRLEEHLRSGADGRITLQRWRWWETGELAVHLTQGDTDAVIERVDRFIAHELHGLMREVTDDVAQSMLKHLLDRWRKESVRQRKEIAGFRRRLEQHWERPLELLRMLLSIARELDTEIDPHTQSRASTLVDVLRRLHARACQISDEIIVLLAAGFADGAIARWRTLHEVAIVALFLHQHGEDVAIRYLAHEAVEARKAVYDYLRCYERLGYEPVPAHEVEEIERAAEEALVRFGAAFKNEYGWAAEALGKKAPRITDLERAVGVDHMRAHYRMASHNVHANPKGLFFKLGLLRELDVLLAGPSNAGLTDPGHSAAISLSQVSAALLTLTPTLDNIVKLKVMSALEQQIGDAFHAAHAELARLDEALHETRRSA